MGNVLTTVQNNPQTLNQNLSFKACSSHQKEDKEEVLLLKLSELKQVELLRLHWCLSHNFLLDFPAIPQHWLRSADDKSTAKIMLCCYHPDGALRVLDAALDLINGNDNICQLHLHQTDAPKPRQVIRPAPKPDPDFMKTQRRKLICHIQWLDVILDLLQDRGVLNTSNREAINIYAVQEEKNRTLVNLVLTKGSKAQEFFYEALSQSEPFLLQELEKAQITAKNSSEKSIIKHMTDFLAIDEFSLFYWLVRDYMIVNSTSRKQPKSEAMNILLKIVPTFRVCLPDEKVTPQHSLDITAEMIVDRTEVEVKPEVFEDGNMFRLRCQKPGVFRCSLTGLLLEGAGDVVYQMVPWDVDFLSSKGLRPAGPLFRFTLLEGSFKRLHLPHCQLLKDNCSHFLSVAHVTGDSMDLIKPDQVTESHVIINVQGFSCFGLVTVATCRAAIHGLVLLFSKLSEHSLFVLLLPRNICLAQVIKECKQRNRMEFVETSADCELIPSQMYKLSGQPVSCIQPETSKFLNFSDYNNFLPSFHIQLAADVSTVELQLSSYVTSVPLIGWLFGSTYVWHRVVHLRAPASTLKAEELVDVTLLLFGVMNSLGSDDLRFFQRLLSMQTDPIPAGRLEGADRTKTVDLMVQQYCPEGAKQVTEDILRTMNYKQLADQLHRS